MYTLIKLAFKVSDMANKASSDYLMSLCKIERPIMAVK